MNDDRPTAIPDPVATLPAITADLPGIGGTIKVEPDRFVVREIPAYEPSGEGEHIFVSLTRAGWNTHDLQRRLAQLFDLHPNDVGYAGRKDKQALVTQTFSLPLRLLDPAEVAERIAGELAMTVHWARRNRNKLKPGHLRGNHFGIVIEGVAAGALEQAALIARALQARGVPNYYGAQRFGTDGDNAARGRAALLGQGPRQQWLRRFMLSAYQSGLFNRYLAARIERGWFDRLLAGDLAKKTDTGGLFVVEDVAAEQPRYGSGAITFTGPIYGARMKWAEGEPGALEREILAADEIAVEHLKAARLEGSRRSGRIELADLVVEEHPLGLRLSFSLPAGAYATMVIREFTQTSTGALPEED